MKKTFIYLIIGAIVLAIAYFIYKKSKDKKPAQASPEANNQPKEKGILETVTDTVSNPIKSLGQSLGFLNKEETASVPSEPTPPALATPPIVAVSSNGDNTTVLNPKTIVAPIVPITAGIKPISPIAMPKVVIPKVAVPKAKNPKCNNKVFKAFNPKACK